MPSAWYEQRILTALRSVPSGTLQMRLAAMADRDLAIALSGLLPEDADSVIRILPAAKAGRVRQEKDYLSRLRVSGAHRRIMAERLADAMEGRSTGRGGTWIAPGEDRRR